MPLFIFITLVVSLIGFFYNKKRKKLKQKFKEICFKISEVNNTISDTLEKRENECYYDELYMVYHYRNNIMMNIKKRYTSNNIRKTNILFNKIDKLYLDLTKDLRLLDNFEEFVNKFTKMKSGYRNSFKKSLKTLDKLYISFGEKDVDKYLVDFNKDYSIYKEKEISKLNSLVKKAKEDRDDFELEELKDKFNTIKKLSDDLCIKLNEPQRLKEKFEASLNNIEQLEEDISNKKGTLYFKTFNLIKNNNVTKDQTNEWNRIKRRINTFNKNRLLGKNIVKLSKSLNDIISDMMDLCDSISNVKESEKNLVK